MAYGATAENRTETAEFERPSPRQGGGMMDRLRQGESVTKIANEIRQFRQQFVKKVELTKEIPLLEKHPFIQKAERVKTEQELLQVQEEFDRHLQESRKRIEAVQKVIDDHRDVLKRHEDQELLKGVMQMPLEQKQKAVTEIDRMLAEREKTMQGTDKLDTKLKEKLGKDSEKITPLGGAERLARMKELEKTNKLFSDYKKTWEKHHGKISEKTMAEHFEWFLNLPPSRHEWALRKAEKEDIQPRVKLYDIHAKLPSQYQSKEFKEMGLTERKNYLLQLERRLDEDYAQLLWSPKIDMSDDSKRFAERHFKSLKSTEKLLQKIEFLQNFPKHAETEAKLRDQLHRYPQRLWQPLVEKFNNSKFEGKVQIIQQIGKLDQEYQALRRELIAMPPQVRAHYEEKFEDAESFDAMKKQLKEMKEFAKYREKYFALLDENERHFSGPRSFREHLYNENVTDLEQAKKAYEELKIKVKIRKALTARYEKLHPHLQARAKNFFKRRPEEKRAILEKLEGIQKVTPTIDMLKTTARDYEQKKDLASALKFYREALRLDPDDEWMNIKVKSLSLKLGIAETAEEQKQKDKTDIDTKKFEEKIENVIDLHGDDVRRLKNLRAAYHAVQQNVQAQGVERQEAERSAQMRAQEEFELNAGEGEEEKQIIKELYQEDQRAIVDQEGRLGKKRIVRHQKGMNEEGLRQLGQELRVEHKTDMHRGRADIEFQEADGRKLSVAETLARNKQAFEEQVNEMTKEMMELLKGDQKKAEAKIRAMVRTSLSYEVKKAA